MLVLVVTLSMAATLLLVRLRTEIALKKTTTPAREFTSLTPRRRASSSPA